MHCIAFDPGYSGAMCDIGRESCLVQPLPLLAGEKAELDIPAILDWLRWRHTVNDVGVIMLEKVSAMPKQGVVSMFRFGTCYGELRGLIKGQTLPLKYVTPQAWKKVILAGMAHDKDASVRYCRDRYPTLSLRRTARCTTDDNNMADAVCIAEYGLKEVLRS